MTSRASLGVLAALTAGAFALRAWGIDRYVVDLHELFQLHAIVTAGSLSAFLSQLRDKPLHVLLDPLLAYAVSRFSTELRWLRLLPVLIGTASVPALYLAARKITGSSTALFSCGLLAASLHHIEFSGVVDFYPLLTLWTLASTYALLVAVEGGRRSEIALYAFIMTGFLYTHPWAALVLTLHGSWLARYHPARLRPFLAATAAAGLLFLPWFLYSLSRVVGDEAFASGPGHSRPLHELWWTVRCWSGEPERGLYDAGSYRLWASVATIVHGGLAALGVWRLSVERRWDSRWSLAALFVLGGVPAVILADRVFAYDYMPRQAIFVLPFFLLFAAEGLSWRPLRRAAPLVVFALFAVLFRDFSGQLARMKNRFTRTAVLTASSTRPGDAVLFDEPNFAAWFLYYYDRESFFRLGRPELRNGFYNFALPEVFQAGEGRSIAVVWDPLSGEAVERARWAGLRARVASGSLRDSNIHFSLMRPMARQKAAEFMAFLRKAP